MESKDLYEIDILDTVYRLLVDNEEFTQEVNPEHIFKYDVPQAYRQSPPIVRITGYQTPSIYGDGEQMGWYGLVQIDLWGNKDPHKLGMKINKIMKNINFKQTDAIPELDKDTFLIRNGKRFEGIIIADTNNLIKE